MGSGCNWRIGVCADVPLSSDKKTSLIHTLSFIIKHPIVEVTLTDGFIMVQTLYLVFLSITVLELFSLYRDSQGSIHRQKEQEFNRDTLNQVDHFNEESSTADAKESSGSHKIEIRKRLFVNQLRNLGSPHERYDDCITLFHEMNFNDVVKKNLRSPYVRDKMFALRLAGDFQLSNLIHPLRNIF